jgi:hypothetical protein
LLRFFVPARENSNDNRVAMIPIAPKKRTRIVALQQLGHALAGRLPQSREASASSRRAIARFATSAHVTWISSMLRVLDEDGTAVVLIPFLLPTVLFGDVADVA